MDKGTSWHRNFQSEADVSQRNLVIQTDGGRREGQCAAAAWIIGAWTGNGNEGIFEPLVAHGTFLEATFFVFATEAIALDEASAEVARIMHHCT